MKDLSVFIFVLACGLFIGAPPSFPQTIESQHDRAAYLQHDRYNPLKHRDTDVVRMLGRQIPEFLGLDIRSIRLLSYRRGVWEPIPFQIDEKDEEGRFLFPYGREKDQEEIDSLLSKHDELLFMARDMGDHVDPSGWPSGCMRAEEIEVVDPLNGERGWCYLFSLEEPPALSPVDLIRYRPEFDRICSRYYETGYARKKCQQKAVMESLLVPEEGGGTGVNFFDSANVWVRIKLFFSLAKIVIHSSDFISQVPAYIDGPIRVITKKRTAVKIAAGLRSPNIDADLVYYPHFFNSALVFAIPFNPSILTSSICISINSDLNHHATGMLFWNFHNPWPVVVDGIMSPQEKVLDLGPDRWRVVSGLQGKYLTKAVYAGNFKMSNIKLGGGVYIDDRTYMEPPENEPGIYGSYNWTWDITHGKRGKYVVWIEAHYGRRIEKPEDVTACLNMTDNPLRIRVGSDESPNCLLVPPPGFTEAILPEACR